MKSEKEAECLFCGWFGYDSELMGAHGMRVCPGCGSDDVQEPEPVTDYNLK